MLGTVTGEVIGHTIDQENEELRQALMGSGVQVRKVGHSIQLTGYNDSTGNDAHNQTLSENRARSVGDYLISQG